MNLCARCKRRPKQPLHPYCRICNMLERRESRVRERAGKPRRVNLRENYPPPDDCFRQTVNHRRFSGSTGVTCGGVRTIFFSRDEMKKAE